MVGEGEDPAPCERVSVKVPTVALADILQHDDKIVAAARRYIAKVQELVSDS